LLQKDKSGSLFSHGKRKKEREREREIPKKRRGMESTKKSAHEKSGQRMKRVRVWKSVSPED